MVKTPAHHCPHSPDRTRHPKPSPRAAPRQPQKRHGGGWTRGRPWRKLLPLSAELSVAGHHSVDMSTGR